jgi:hypothetical protein
VNAAEKISLLETLLVRVRARAAGPRPDRAASEPPSSSAVVVAEPAAPPIAAVHEAPAPSADPSKTITDVPALAAIVMPTPATVVAPATPPPTASTPTKTASGAYVAKGGVADELPELDLGDDEDEEFEDEVPSQDEAEAQELDIPSRPSVMLRAVNAPAPIEVSRDDVPLEIDHTPLASALPAATEESLAAREIPRSSIPAVAHDLELDMSPEALATPSSPSGTSLDFPDFVAPVEAPAEPAAPVVEAAPAVVEAKVEALSPAVPPLTAAAVAEPEVAVETTKSEPEAPRVEASAKPAELTPVVHAAEPLAASALVDEVSALAPPAGPVSFASALRKALALRVR